MLTVLALVVVVVWTGLITAVPAGLVEWRDRRRLARVRAEVRVTDAVHRELGAIVAPVVRRGMGRSWTVAMRVAPGDLAVAGRLVAIAEGAIRGPGRPVRVVLAPRLPEGAGPGRTAGLVLRAV